MTFVFWEKIYIITINYSTILNIQIFVVAPLMNTYALNLNLYIRILDVHTKSCPASMFVYTVFMTNYIQMTFWTKRFRQVISINRATHKEEERGVNSH